MSESATLDQIRADNELLRNGEVNPCIGSFQLQPFTMAQFSTVLISFFVGIIAYSIFGAEIGILTFIILAVGLMILGGRDFNLEKEKMTVTKSYFSETPQLGTGTDNLPKPLFREEPYAKKNNQKYYSIEQEFKHLRFYGSYEKKGANAGFYYLNNGKSPNVYLIFGFKAAGFSPCMDHTDCFAIIKKINRGFKNFPDLKLRFVWELPSDGSAQILQQKRLLESCEQDGLTVEIIKSRGQWATRMEKKGSLVAPQLRVYARIKSPLGQEQFTPQDWKDRVAAQVTPQLARFSDDPRLDLAKKAIDFGFEACCTQTMRVFNGEIGLRTRPLSVHELYCIDFSKLHKRPVDRCPQFVKVKDDGLYFQQDKDNQGQPIISHHILGELFSKEGIPSTPVFYRNNVWYPLKGETDENGQEQGLFAACIRLKQMEGYADIDGSHAVGHLKGVFAWLEGISNIEMITEVEAVNPMRKKQEIDKGITNRQKRANHALRKESHDVDSMEDVDDLMDARREFRAGGQTLSTFTLIWVYAEDRANLQLKVKRVMGRLGASNCVLVQNSIEQLWIDSQPYCWEAMGMNPFRRTEYLIPQAIPLVPFTNVQALDAEGVGYIGKGVSAQYFIDFCGKKNHTFIAAKSGGGKSMQGLEILAQCIATQTPSLFLDSPPLADEQTGDVAPSTYTPAIQCWQSQDVPCAYQDVKKNNFNIIGRYGFGGNQFEIDALVESHLDVLMAGVIGDNPRHPLTEYVKNFISLSYTDFLKNSLNAKKDPILEDYLRHYVNWSDRYLNGDVDLYSIIGVDNLGKFEPSQEERSAAGMIRSQLIGVLAQPWGKRINAQTSFDPDTLHLVLGLTDVKAGSKEGLVYSLSSLSFMGRIAAKYSRTVGLVDEGSTLLPMEAFASKFHRWFPEGRKKGLNGILITTELNSLWESPYCGPILDNFDNILVGLSEKTAVDKFVELLGFKEEILRKYTEEPDKTNMSSNWYLKRGDQHLELEYHTTAMLLGLGATSPEEIKVRSQYLAGVSPNDLVAAQKRLGRDFYAAYAQGKPAVSLLR